MSTVINTNVQALNSQRALKIVSEQSGKASEKLSSGLRVNRAGDDAAGLAISEKMRGQIRGLNQASRNSQDGISLIQTAEGALTETHSMLQRMRELVIQASNDSNQESDRELIALELNELSEEINSTAEKTEFNKRKLIDGSWEDNKLYFQVGANEQQSIEFNIAAMNAVALGVTKDEIGQVVAGVNTPGGASKVEVGPVISFDIPQAVGSSIIGATAGNVTDGIKFNGDGTFTIGTGVFNAIGKNASFFGFDAEKYDSATGSAKAGATFKVSELANKTISLQGKIYKFSEDGKSYSVSEKNATAQTADYTIKRAAGSANNDAYILAFGGTAANAAAEFKTSIDLGDGASLKITVSGTGATKSSYTLEGEVIDINTGKKITLTAGGTGFTVSALGTAADVSFFAKNGDLINVDAATGDIRITKAANIEFDTANAQRVAPDTVDATNVIGKYESSTGGVFEIDDTGRITNAGTGFAIKDVDGNRVGATGAVLTADDLKNKTILTDKGLMIFADDGKSFTLDTNVKTDTIAANGTYQTTDENGAFTITNGKVDSDFIKEVVATDGTTVKSVFEMKGKTFELNDGRFISINNDGFAAFVDAPTTTKSSSSSEPSTTKRNEVAEAAAKEAADKVAGLASGESRGKVISTLVLKLDAALDIVSAQRAQLGAYQNRMEHTIKNLDTSSENLSAAESRIRDTDMAKEMMDFTKSNVLSQAAQSMLAQANQAPNNVLSLLR